MNYEPDEPTTTMSDEEYQEQLEHDRMRAEYDEMIYRGCRDD
jgi:hypothetical protein